MIAYVIRRVAYAVPILIGVNLLTFLLFFVVNTPDDMARMQLGVRRVTAEAVEKWKAERGYDKPMLYNAKAGGLDRLTDTIFFEKSVRLFVSISAMPTTAARSATRSSRACGRASRCSFRYSSWASP